MDKEEMLQMVWCCSFSACKRNNEDKFTAQLIADNDVKSAVSEIDSVINKIKDIVK